MGGAFQLLERSYTRVFYGDFQIRHIDYDKEPKSYIHLSDIQNVTNFLNNYSDTNVKTAYRGVNFSVVEFAGKQYALQLVAVNPANESDISILPDKIIDGYYLDSDNQVVIGHELAKFLNVSVGDYLTIMTFDIYDSFVIDVFQVSGIYRLGDINMDKMFAFIHISYYFANISYDPNIVTHVAFDIDDRYYLQPLINEIHQLINISSQEIVSWEEILPSVKQAIDFETITSNIFFTVLIILVAFVVLNAIVLSTIKRTPEFGILICLGLDHKYLKWLLIFENAILSGFSVILGSSIGMLLLYYFTIVGIPLPSLTEASDKPLLLLESVLYPNLRSPLLFIPPIVVFLSSLCSVIVPIRRMSSINPVKSLTT